MIYLQMQSRVNIDLFTNAITCQFLDIAIFQKFQTKASFTYLLLSFFLFAAFALNDLLFEVLE